MLAATQRESRVSEETRGPDGADIQARSMSEAVSGSGAADAPEAGDATAASDAGQSPMVAETQAAPMPFVQQTLGPSQPLPPSQNLTPGTSSGWASHPWAPPAPSPSAPTYAPPPAYSPPPAYMPWPAAATPPWVPVPGTVPPPAAPETPAASPHQGWAPAFPPPPAPAYPAAYPPPYSPPQPYAPFPAPSYAPVSQPYAQLWTPPAPMPMSTRKKVALVGAIVLVVCLVGAAAIATTPKIGGGSVTADSSIDPTAGAVVFSDDFTNDVSGWFAGHTSDGASFEYSPDGYVAGTGTGNIVHFAYAPDEQRFEEVAALATVSSPAGSDDDTGFGLACRRGSGGSTLSYEFLVYGDGSWYIGRREGVPNDYLEPDTIAEDGGLSIQGSTGIEAICATLDSRSTRLVLFVNGEVVADMIDSDASVPSGGWATGIAVASGWTDSGAFTYTHFETRDLTGRAAASSSARQAISSATTSARPPIIGADQTPLSLYGGRVAFTADFGDPDGWTGSGQGWTANLGSDYSVTVTEPGHHLIGLPYDYTVLWLGVRAVVTQSPGSAESGFAVACTRDSGPTQLTYSFFVRGDGSWNVERIEGAPDNSGITTPLPATSSTRYDVTRPTMLEAVCATIDSTATHLDFYIDDHLVFDYVDANPGSSFGAWLATLDVRGEAGQNHHATISTIEILDLER